jgi:eukaryotic-like serine/threonine-protein kinase
MGSPQLAGTILGRYRIREQLGAGGMGIVYRARDERLERDVAVKVLPPGLLSDEHARSRFHKEALALAKLNHANIAAVYDVGEQDGLDYLVMEYVPGESLGAKLRSGPLPPFQAFALAGEIASALEQAHEQGVVHRDLKPGNIIVTPKGHAKVLDFGLAKLLARDGEDVTRSLGGTHGAVGTPLYMSPEQAEGKLVDCRTDLWSLGVVLYESVTGKVPFQGDSGFAVLRAITEQNPTPLREVRPDAPPQAERIVSRALEKDVTQRYQTAAEMSRDLSEALTQLSTPALPRARQKVLLSRPYAIAAGFLLVLFVVGGWLYHQAERRYWAKEEAIPEIAKLKNEDKSLAAYRLLQEVARYLPADPQVTQMVRDSTQPVSITSSPPGATVEIQDYVTPDGPWLRIGTTPLTDVRLPSGYFRWKLSKQGYGEYLVAPPTSKQMSFALDEMKNAPSGMVWVNANSWVDMIDFVGWIGPYDLPAYYVDRFEVTNREFQQFIDQGGYRKREYWKEPFIKDGRELTWEQAMALFHDRTGRPGSSTWEGGHYPVGQADYPVSGVSWYEASAYAAFAGKSLPVLAQFFHASPPYLASYLVRLSNISASGPTPVSAFKGLGPYGTYDMAGNVREWVQNTTTGANRFILGGAWNSESYLSVNPEALPAFDRSPTNGFRCVRNTATLPRAAVAPIQPKVRDFSAAKPVSDEVFRAYKALYAYDKTPLNAKVEGITQETADWREEKITFDASYGNERMLAYLFLPKNVRQPYQTVVFFPSARVLDLSDSQKLGDVKFFDYIVQSGRAVLYPIYQGTYERQAKLVLPGAAHDVELITKRSKDLARSLDYLETRPDIDKDKLAYLGVSMGSAEGVIYACLAQDRLRTVIFLDGGFFLGALSPAIDQVNFAPRLKKPVLMVNGRYDYTFSLERSQIPLFRMLGSPEADKKHIVLETPHDVTNRKSELVPDVLGLA